MSRERELRKENDPSCEDIKWKLKNASICELGADNISISDYMNHWEGRALRAECSFEKSSDKISEVLQILEKADLSKLKKPLLWANAISAARVAFYRAGYSSRKYKNEIQTKENNLMRENACNSKESAATNKK